MDSSEAKAVIKGGMRRVGYRWDTLEEEIMAGELCFTSRSTFHKHIQRSVRYRGDLLIHQQTHHTGSSWHQQVEIAAVTGEYQFTPQVGNLASIVLEFYDSKRFLKGDALNGYRMFTSRLYLHEHFLERMVQRTGLPTIGTVGKLVYQLLRTLMIQFPDPVQLESECYVVTPEMVMVLVKHPALTGAILKTVLLCEQFTDLQQAFFALPCQQLRDKQYPMLLFLPQAKQMVPIKIHNKFLLWEMERCASSQWLHNMQDNFDMRGLINGFTSLSSGD